VTRFVTLLLILLLSVTLAQELEIHFIDVGQGDAVFIRAPGGQGVLYDGGRRSQVPLNYLRSIGVTQVDLVIASHADADHIAGLAAVVEAYRPRFFMDNGIPHTTQTYFNLLETVAQAGSQLLEPTNRRITLGEVVLQVIPPPGIPSYGNNDNSVGLVIEYGQFRAALTGDAEARQFNWWEENVPELLVPVQVYKSSHHGSENGDTPLAMSRFRPEVVVIGVGADNSYGHPSERALRLYDTIGAQVYRTDLHGTVLVRAQQDGSYRVSTERAAAMSPTPPAPVAPTPAVPAPTPAPPPEPTGSLEIVCALYNPAGQDDGQEVVTLRASGQVNTSGWYVMDEAQQRLSVPVAALASGDIIEVRSTRAVWNNDGDTVLLYDPAGRLVDILSYAGGGVEACR
jgi:competence protein ComEC